MDRAAIEQQLAQCRPFADPQIDLEQYVTPADLAAHVVHLASLQGDLERPVIDLGTGTGMLALGAVLAGAETVLGIDVDRSALSIATDNADRLDVGGTVKWIMGDVTTSPLCPAAVPTVMANPPFGAVDGAAGADRGFLETAARLGGISYTLHNAGSREFVAAFVKDHGGSITRAYHADFDVDRTFPWHEQATETLAVELFRIDWR